MKKGCSWETCLHLHAGFLLPHLSFPRFLSRLISHWLSAHNLVFGSAVPKIKGLHKGKGRKWAQRLGGWVSKAVEREPGRFFSSLSPNSLQNSRPLFSVGTSTYLVPWIFSIPAPSSGALGPESPLSKNVEGIMSLVKWRGTKICFAGRSEELLGVFTGPCEAEICLNQSQKR